MKNKKINSVLTFSGLLYVVMIVLLFYIVGVLVQMNKEYPDEENKPSVKVVDLNKETGFASYFPECDLLNSECLDTNCKQYFLCSGKEYLRCEVYDCGENFGVGARDKNGEIDITRKAKDNKKKIAEIKNRCNGSVEVVENNCVDEKLEMAVKVVTGGDCEIEGFLIGYGNQENGEKISFKPAKFLSLGSGIYSISLNNCNEVGEVIAIGENGVSIK